MGIGEEWDSQSFEAGSTEIEDEFRINLTDFYIAVFASISFAIMI